MDKERLEKQIFRLVLNPRLNTFVKEQARITRLTELQSLSIGNVRIEPAASTHLRVSAPTQSELEDFLAGFKKPKTS